MMGELRRSCFDTLLLVRNLRSRSVMADGPMVRPEIGLAGQRLLNFLNLYQVLHLTDHTQYLRSGFHFLGSVQLVETQRFQGQFLTLRPVNAALDLCYLDLCHSLNWFGYLLSVENFL